jgi:hypothetical protein
MKPFDVESRISGGFKQAMVTKALRVPSIVKTLQHFPVEMAMEHFDTFASAGTDVCTVRLSININGDFAKVGVRG